MPAIPRVGRPGPVRALGSHERRLLDVEANPFAGLPWASTSTGFYDDNIANGDISSFIPIIADDGTDTSVLATNDPDRFSIEEHPNPETWYPLGYTYSTDHILRFMVIRGPGAYLILASSTLRYAASSTDIYMQMNISLADGMVGGEDSVSGMGFGAASGYANGVEPGSGDKVWNLSSGNLVNIRSETPKYVTVTYLNGDAGQAVAPEVNLFIARISNDYLGFVTAA